MRTLTLAAVLLCCSCASFRTSLPESGSERQRAALAGQTLRCSADAERHAMALGAGALVSSWVSTTSTALASSSTDPGVSLAAGAAGCGFGVLSLGLAAATLVRVWDAASYEERAGEVAAGLSDVGCADDALPGE